MAQVSRNEVTDYTRLLALNEQREIDRLLRIYTAQLAKFIKRDRLAQVIFELLLFILVVLTALESFDEDYLWTWGNSIHSTGTLAAVAGAVLTSNFVNKMLKYSQKVKALKDAVAGCLVLENDWKGLVAEIENWVISDEEARKKIEELLRLKLVTVDNQTARANIPVDRKLNDFHSKESNKVMNETEEYFDQASGKQA